MQVQRVSEMGRPLKGEPKVQPGAEAKAAGLGAQDLAGLLFDRDNVACYGDPAWDARMAAGKLNWEQTLTAADGTFTFSVKPLAGADTFKAVNQNGSQRGGRTKRWRIAAGVSASRLTGGRCTSMRTTSTARGSKLGSRESGMSAGMASTGMNGRLE